MNRMKKGGMGLCEMEYKAREHRKEERGVERRGEEGRSDERMLRVEKGKGGERLKCPSFIFP